MVATGGGAPLAGCAFTLSDINSSVTVGRSFDDGRIFDTGRTVWGMTVTGHYVRDGEVK